VYTGKAHQKSKKGLIECGVPAIIDTETLNKVVLQMQKFNKYNRKQKKIYLLSGLIRCGVCNWKYAAQANKNKQGKVYYQYRCANSDRIVKCDNKAIKMLDIDSGIWQVCTHILLHYPEYIAQGRDELNNILENPTSIKAQIITLQSR
jgi:hypothetical protein